MDTILIYGKEISLNFRNLTLDYLGISGVFLDANFYNFSTTDKTVINC